MVETRGEKLLKRALPVGLAVVIAGGGALERAGIINFSDSKASANTPSKVAGSITVESTINGVYGGQDIDVTCSGFDGSNVATLDQGEGVSVLIGQVAREPGITDGAVTQAIEKANGLEDGMPQPDTNYRVPEACAIDG